MNIRSRGNGPTEDWDAVEAAVRVAEELLAGEIPDEWTARGTAGRMAAASLAERIPEELSGGVVRVQVDREGATARGAVYASHFYVRILEVVLARGAEQVHLNGVPAEHAKLLQLAVAGLGVRDRVVVDLVA